jgi:hypothetical protein
MSDLTKKILESGLVDEATARLMERWGNLPEGSAELTKNKPEHLQNATREELMKFAEDIGEEVDKQRRMRETMLDMDRLRFPVHVKIYKQHIITDDGAHMGKTLVAGNVNGVIDRMGRYYFRFQDVRENWFVPGYVIQKQESGEEKVTFSLEEITESQVLSAGESPVCIQVSVQAV